MGGYPLIVGDCSLGVADDEDRKSIDDDLASDWLDLEDTLADMADELDDAQQASAADHLFATM